MLSNKQTEMADKQNIIQTLLSLGLNENEASVYMAALNLGPATVLQIARASGVKRTTIYSTVESLKQKGLMNIELKGFKKLFVVAHPERLESILETQRNRFQQVLPELSALYNLKGGESFIKYYEGLEAVKPIYDELIKRVRPREDYCIISDQEKWYNQDPVYFEDFTKRRARLNINIRLLLIDTPMARDFQKRQKNYNMTIKLLPNGSMLSTNLVIIPQMVLIHQTIEPIWAMVIENKSIIQMHRELFKMIWDSTQI